jgi:uncharacterized protein (TIGR00251 family)
MAADASKLAITPRPGGIELRVKVVPGASRSRLAGRLGEVLKVAVAAPPEGGKANAALIEILAAALGVKRSEVVVVSGHGAPLKRIVVVGLSVHDARARLSGQGGT